MSKKIYFNNENQKFVNALINVAKLLEPNVEFNDVIVQKHVKGDGSVEMDYSVSGFKKCGTFVQVTKELRDVNKGLEIVVRYVNPITQEVIKERGVWYFSFNWKGLMESWEE